MGLLSKVKERLAERSDALLEWCGCLQVVHVLVCHSSTHASVTPINFIASPSQPWVESFLEPVAVFQGWKMWGPGIWFHSITSYCDFHMKCSSLLYQSDATRKTVNDQWVGPLLIHNLMLLLEDGGDYGVGGSRSLSNSHVFSFSIHRLRIKSTKWPWPNSETVHQNQTVYPFITFLVGGGCWYLSQGWEGYLKK